MRVMGVLGDRGAGEAVVPVLAELLRNGAEVSAVSAAASITLLTEAQVPALECGRPVDAGVAHRLLQARRPAALLTTTSWGGSRVERPFLAAARRLGIPSIALLDFWSNYRERFAELPNEPLCLPDQVAVVDEAARDGAIAAGLPPRRVVVTGSPHYERLRGMRARDPWTIERLRRVAMLRPEAAVVLFASQPLRALYGGGLPYTEVTVQEAVERVLAGVARRHGIEVVLAVRSHPRADPVDAGPRREGGLRVTPADRGDAADWIIAADLVVGMTSAVLVQALTLGVGAVSIQPGGGASPFPEQAFAGGRRVTELAQLPEALAGGLDPAASRTIGAARDRWDRSHDGAAARIVELLRQLAAGAPREVMA
jgi:hypothetical protein